MEDRQLARPKTWRKRFCSRCRDDGPRLRLTSARRAIIFRCVSPSLGKRRPLWSEQSEETLLTGRKKSRLKGFLLCMNRAITLLPSGSSPVFFVCSGGWLVLCVLTGGPGRSEHTLGELCIFFASASRERWTRWCFIGIDRGHDAVHRGCVIILTSPA